MRGFAALLVAIAISATGAFTSQAFARSNDGYERWVDIVNMSDLAIEQVRISNIDEDYYGPDLLRNTVIYGYDEARVEPRRPDGYCRFDALITYEDGTQVQVWNVNLCEATTIRVDDNGYTDVWYS